VMLALLRLQLARQRGDLGALAEEARSLLAAADAPETAHPELGEDLRALALLNLGIAELWAERIEDADRHLEEGIAVARRIERPYLELTGLAHGTLLAIHHSHGLAAQRAREAAELAGRHGWADEPVVGVAYTMLGGVLVGQGRLEEADRWLRRAGRALRAEAEPAANVTLQLFRGLLELASGRYEKALDTLRGVVRLAGLLVTPFPGAIHVFHVQALVKAGALEQAEAALAEIDEAERDGAYAAIALAVLRLAQHDPRAAAVALAPLVDGPVGAPDPFWTVEVLLLEAMARRGLGDDGAAACALERALDFAEPDSVLVPFLFHREPDLLERHRRQRTGHAALVSEILDLLAETGPPRAGEPGHLREPLTEGEMRVLRYLPTNLSQREIAGELSLSSHTVSTHVRHLYAKLDVHRRREAVERARDLGMLARSSSER